MPASRLLSLVAMSALAIVAPSIAMAATIYGNIVQGGSPVAGAVLTLTCPRLPPVQTQTDGQGNYHFSLGIQGLCQMSIQVGTLSKDFQVALSPNPNRYNFEWVPNNSPLQRR